MINRTMEHPMERTEHSMERTEHSMERIEHSMHYAADERRHALLAAAAQERLLAGSPHDRRHRGLRRRAGGWISRAMRGRAS